MDLIDAITEAFGVAADWARILTGDLLRAGRRLLERVYEETW